MSGAGVQIPNYDQYPEFIVTFSLSYYQIHEWEMIVPLGGERPYGFRSYNGYYYWIWAGYVTITNDGKITINAAWGTEYGDRPTGSAGIPRYNVYGTNVDIVIPPRS